MSIFGTAFDSFKKRDASSPSSQVGFLTTQDAWDILCTGQYTRLDKNPEILAGCRKIADLISSMTIYLMANEEDGDHRIKNELSAKIDIDPCHNMTRKTWMDLIVMNLLLHGKGNSIVMPKTKRGFLDEMIPVDPDDVKFIYYTDRSKYRVEFWGKEHDPDSILHFTFNQSHRYPWKGEGITTTIKDIAYNLKQATETEKGFMQSKWKPSVIVMVDALADEFADAEGRSKLLKDYISTEEVGQPWVIPSEEMKVETVKPLTLKDLAIDSTIELNKRTVASILGVPTFILGVGDFRKEEWNNFINSTIRPIAQGIEQELTKKILLKPEWYFQFNIASLYEYDLETLANVYGDLYTKGLVFGNEVRDKIGLSPAEGLDELILLENYIKLDDIANQGKLNNQKGEENE